MRATTYRQVLTGIILAGGKAGRIKGRDKAFLKIGKDRLIDIQLRSLKKIFSRQAILNEGGIPPEAGKRIIVVTNSPQGYKNLKGVKLVSDIIPDIGPLGGIYSGLLASKSFYNFVIACDMPYINLSLIKYMYKKARGYDVVVPEVNHRYEPLFGIYSKNCLEIIKESLSKKNFKIRKFFPKIKLKVVSKKEILRFGHPEQLFMNINTQRELSLIQPDR